MSKSFRHDPDDLEYDDEFYNKTQKDAKVREDRQRRLGDKLSYLHKEEK